jgi:ABC-2 type transport system ATP-binding protein
MLRSSAAEGRVVLVSSHLMAELEGTADHLVVVGRGRLLADAPVSDLLDRSAVATAVTVRSPDRARVMTLLARAGATVASEGGDAVEVEGLAPEQVSAPIVGSGLRLDHLATRRPTLEEVYLRLTGSLVDYAAAPVGQGRR